MLGWVEVFDVEFRNLKEFSCSFPRNKFVVVTGPSGAGKSTFVFDVLFQEAVRQYSLALPSKNKSKLDSGFVTGLSFPMAVELERPGRSRLATLSTLSGIEPYLETLFFHLGERHCVSCNSEVREFSAEEIANKTIAESGAEIIEINWPLSQSVTESKKQQAFSRSQGFSRIRIGNDIRKFSKEKSGSIIIEALVGSNNATTIRVYEAIQLIKSAGGSEVEIVSLNSAKEIVSQKIFPLVQRCEKCGLLQETLTRESFSHLRINGRCKSCGGSGEGCAICQGSRLKLESAVVRLAGLSLAELRLSTVARAKSYVKSLRSIVGPNRLKRAVYELENRLEALSDLGLSYLTLCRSAASMSNGERSRAAIGRELGNSTQGVLYLLDEPSCSLHPSDLDNLYQLLRRLIANGSSVLAIEHERTLIERADYVIELGPGAGTKGGRVLFSESIPELLNQEHSKTSRLLKAPDSFFSSHRSKRQPKNWLCVKSIKKFNIVDLDLNIPLGVLVGVVGVSGSGKSTAFSEVIIPALKILLKKDQSNASEFSDCCFKEICGYEGLSGALEVSDFRSSLSGTRLINLGGLLKEICKIFSLTLEAKVLGYTAKDFSLQIEDISSDMRAVCYRGKNINEVIDLTVSEAKHFFKAFSRLRVFLQQVEELGLGYLRLSQPVQELSSGEWQRLKLAEELGSKKNNVGKLILFDEPSRGLHVSELPVLLDLFSSLSDAGNSLIVIEHDPLLTAHFDYIIEFGPGAGEAGGRVIAIGTPDELRRNSNSLFGKYL